MYFTENDTKMNTPSPKIILNGNEIEFKTELSPMKTSTPQQPTKYYRPSFDDYFMSIAHIVATRSTCDRLRAGAVLIKDKRIIATGYNGAPSGLPHCDGEEGHKMEEGHCIRTLHAEENTILQLASSGGTSSQGATLYTTHNPCYHCTKKIITAGIKKVICGTTYRDISPLKDLSKAGIVVEMYDSPKPEWIETLKHIFYNSR